METVGAPTVGLGDVDRPSLQSLFEPRISGLQNRGVGQNK